MCIPLGGSKSAPSLPPVVAPPPVIDTTKDNTQSSSARSDQQKRAALAKGNASTINSSPLGVQDPAQVKKPSLLGLTD